MAEKTTSARSSKQARTSQTGVSPDPVAADSVAAEEPQVSLPASARISTQTLTEEGGQYTGQVTMDDGSVLEELKHNEQRFSRYYTAKELGRMGEALACEYLKMITYEIKEKNWRCKIGEVDIVAQTSDDVTVLCEVKTRINYDPHLDVLPEQKVTTRKMNKYKKMALYYLAKHPSVCHIRFDVIAVTVDSDRFARIQHTMGAFAWDDSADVACGAY